jgi:general secretion pathway protein D
MALCCALTAFLSACADRPVLPELMNVEPSRQAATTSDSTPRAASTRIDRLPNPQPPAAAPKPGGVPTLPGTSPGAAAAGDPALLNLEQVPLATFAQLVFADVLKKNVNIDPQVLARRDLVTFRSGSPQTAAQLEAAAVLLLKSYGVAAIDLGGLVRVVPDNASLGNLPEIRRGAALPDTPLPLRPIFYLVELQAVRHLDVMNWLRTLFGERVRAQEDSTRNALLISGTPDNVQAALEAIRMLDQPVLAGGQSLAINPVNWSAEDLARRMIEVLLAQGYAVQPQGQGTTPGAIRYPIIVLPVASINAVYVFARGDEVIKHISDLARALDKPSERGGIGKNFFTYAVKHKDAATLAETLQQLLSGVAARTAPAPVPGAAPNLAGLGRNSVVVDKSTNTLIFQVAQEEYAQIIALLQTLDRPARAALIEVTVAELSVDDSARLGVEWGFTDSQGGGGTVGGLGLGTTGFNYRILNAVGGVKVALNALATANRATILSSPRVLARNGELATIQVGQEVPIVTSQQSTNTNNTQGNAQILQTIQYRSTGVILRVKPVIHSGDQIDLDVTQEVSSAGSTSTGVSASPTFSTRKVDTKLTLRNGATVMLGGLISEDTTRGNTGVPGLKDIPFVGHLFSNQNQTGGRRELIVLITPYLVNDNTDAEALTDAFRRVLGPWAATPARPTGLPVSGLSAEPAPAPPPAQTPRP